MGAVIRALLALPGSASAVSSSCRAAAKGPSARRQKHWYELLALLPSGTAHNVSWHWLSNAASNSFFSDLGYLSIKSCLSNEMEEIVAQRFLASADLAAVTDCFCGVCGR